MKHVFNKILAVMLVIGMLCSLTACFEFLHTHTYSEIGSNKTHHWKYCPDDETRDEDSLEKHVDENADGKCDVCGYEVGLPHVHDYTAWGSDADNHWKYCPEDNAKDSSSVAPHADEDKDGKCDSCGTDMEAPVEEYVGIEEIDGVPTLVVKGVIPDGVACVRLHIDANNDQKFWSNTSNFVGAYEFKVALTELPAGGTPWCWFHIYAYAVADPSDATEPARKIDLPRGELIEVGHKYIYDGMYYEIIKDGESTQLIIQPKPIPAGTVSSIELKVVEGKPVVVVKGTVTEGAKVASFMLHCDGNSRHYYGTPAVPVDGQFELTMDLSGVTVDDTPWLWFHVYAYATETAPDASTAYSQYFDLKRGDLIAVDTSIEANDITYTVKNNDQLVVQPVAVPKMTVTSITVDIADDGKPTLVVKGTLPTGIKCIKLHADAANVHYFGDNVSTESGKFELRFDVTQIPTENTPWAWFHIYTYDVENPEDPTTDFDYINLARGDFLPVGASVTYNNVKYTVQDQDQFVIQATVAE